jgi:mannose-6-phosphate isomerase-like protein (cupin superfamily)
MSSRFLPPRSSATLVAALALAALPALSASACEGHDAHQAVHIAVAPADLQWQPGPGSLPPGAEFVVIEGNPAEAGPLTLRLKFPANYQVPAHTHPAIEHITVLSGSLNVGMGDRLDEAASTRMDTGSFVIMPVGHSHYVWTEEEAVLQLHSIGPWGIDYIDPINDPRLN